MTDNKAGGLVRNAFSQESRYLRRNSSEVQRIRVTPKINTDLARYPQIMHQSFLAPSARAIPSTPSEADTGTVLSWNLASRLPYFNRPLTEHEIDAEAWRTDTSVRPKTRRHSSPNTPIGLGIHLQQASWDSPSTDGCQSPFYYNNPVGKPSESKTKSTPEFYGLPANPKPGHQFKEFKPHQVPRNESSQVRSQEPKNIGWGHILSPSPDLQKDTSAESTQTSWPTSNQQKPQVKFGVEEVSTHVPVSSTYQKHPASTANLKGRSRRSQSNQAYMNKFHDVTTHIIKVYKQGPKGEGQKLWKSLRNGKSEGGRKDASSSSYARWKDTQKEQLDKVYAESSEFPTPKPVISGPVPISTTSNDVHKPRKTSPPPKITTHSIPSPLQSHPVPPPIPARPGSLGVQRSPVPVESLRDSMFIPPRSGDVESTLSSRTASIPIMITRNVQMEATRIPNKTTEEKKLPPRPALAPGEKEPPELKHQAKMYKERTGHSPPQLHAEMFAQPPRPAPAKAAGISNHSTLAVGSDSRFVHKVPAFKTQANQAHFASLDDRLAKHGPSKPKDKGTKHRFADAVFNFFDPPASNQPARSKEVPILKHPKGLIANIVSARQELARTKHEEKLKQTKQAISYPRPIDFGPAGIPPPIPKKSAKRESVSGPVGKPHNFDTSSEGSRPARVPPPVPALPQEYISSLPSSETIIKSKSKESKQKDKSDKKAKPNWTGAVYDILPGRKRADSGDSFGCVDAHRVTEQHRRAEQAPQQKPTPKRDSGVMSGFQVFRGPVRVGHVKTQGREVEASGKVGHGRQYSDETMVPGKLNIRKVERDTEFYQPVHSVINGYADHWI